MALHRLVASLLVVGSLAGTAPAAFAQADADSYFEFLMARRLEGHGRFRRRAGRARARRAGRRRARPRCGPGRRRSTCAAASPTKPRRRRRPRWPSTRTNIEAHRALGLVYAGYADGGTRRAVDVAGGRHLSEGRHHAPRARGRRRCAGDLVLHFTLGRLYLRTDTAATRRCDSLNRVVAQNPGSVQARLAAGAGARRQQGPAGGHRRRSRSSWTTSRAWPRRSASTRNRPAASARRRRRTPRRSKCSR